MQKEFDKEEIETEDILKKLQKEKKRKRIEKGISISIILVILAIIVFLTISYLSYRYWKSPEMQLKLGAEIENISFSKNMETAYIKLKAGSNLYNITKVKFSFLDLSGAEYVFETTEGISEIEVPYSRSFWDYVLGIFGKKPDYLGVYNYELSSDEIGVENFNNIDKVSVIFEYETETGEVIETPKLDTEKQKPIVTTIGGGGGDGGGTTTQPGCTPESKETTCGNWICGIKKNNCNEDVNCGSCNEAYNCENGNCILQTTGLYEGLVGYWKFETEISRITPDETGVNQGNLINNASIINDTEKGNVLSLDSDNDYVDAGNDSSLNLQGALTLTAWIYPVGWGDSDRAMIIDKGNSTTGFSFWMGNGTCRPRTFFYVIYGGWVESAPADSIELNKWQHVVVVYNQTNGGYLNFYKNGIEIRSALYNRTNRFNCAGNVTPAAGAPGGNPFNSDIYNLSIGIRTQKIGSPPEYEFNGSIDEVMIYNRALNESEILEIYEGQKPQVVEVPNVYYISNQEACSDNWDGNSTHPWCNINRSQNYKVGYIPAGYNPMVQPGDIVIVRNGSYGIFNEDNVNNPRDKWYITTRTDWITYKAAPGHKPILNNIKIRNEDAWNHLVNGNSYLIFDGFHITDGVNAIYTNYLKIMNCVVEMQPVNVSGYWEPYWRFNDDAAFYFGYDITHINVENCEVKNAFTGIKFVPNSENVVIKNNVIHYIAGDGISVSASDMLIENNTISDIDNRRSSVGIVGTYSGSFEPGETLIQSSSGAEGIYDRVISGWPYAYITTQQEFAANNVYPEKNGIIEGNMSHETITNVTMIDPIHSDSVEIMAYSRNEHNITFQKNTMRQFIPGLYIQNGQGIKIDSTRPGQMSDFLFVNNLFNTGRPFLILGVEDIKISNNTFYGTISSAFQMDANDPDTIISEMYNNIFNGIILTGDKLPYIMRVVSHGNNIFGNNPNGEGGPTHPFIVNSSSELVNVNVTDLFVDVAVGNFSPRMDKAACNGSVNEVGVAVGALPCICTDNSQCEQVFGAGDTCDIQTGRCSSMPSLSPFTRIWNFLKSLLTGKTGQAILTGKITGNAVNNEGKADYEKPLIVLVIAVIIIGSIIIIIKAGKKKVERIKKYRR